LWKSRDLFLRHAGHDEENEARSEPVMGADGLGDDHAAAAERG
jgi:hypothetical protein